MNSGLLEETAAGNVPMLVPLTVDQYEQMVREHVIPDDSPIELIDGLLVYKDRSGTGEGPMVINPRHTLLISLMLEKLGPWAQSIGHYVRIQMPVTLTQFSQPEPDLALVAGNPRTYADRNPGPGDVAAVFEVADSSLRRDRTTKQRLYAGAGIPVYWIVNLSENQIEIYDRPLPGSDTYGRCLMFAGEQTVSLTIGEHLLDLKVSELLG